MKSTNHIFAMKILNKAEMLKRQTVSPISPYTCTCHVYMHCTCIHVQCVFELCAHKVSALFFSVSCLLSLNSHIFYCIDGLLQGGKRCACFWQQGLDHKTALCFSRQKQSGANNEFLSEFVIYSILYCTFIFMFTCIDHCSFMHVVCMHMYCT